MLNTPESIDAADTTQAESTHASEEKDWSADLRDAKHQDLPLEPAASARPRKGRYLAGTVLGNILGVVLWVLLAGFTFLVALSADSLYHRLGMPMWPLELAEFLLLAIPVVWLICLFASIALLFRNRLKAGLIASYVPAVISLVMGAIYFVWMMWDSL